MISRVLLYKEEVKEADRSTAEDYYARPEGDRVELIRGRFYDMASPSRIHQEISGEIYYQISRHIREKGSNCRVYTAPFDVKLRSDRDDIVQPDVLVICDPSKLTERGCTGGPDWVIEIVSPASAHNDYMTKLFLYHDAGVMEYWIVDPGRRFVTVYDLEDEEFRTSGYYMDGYVPVGICEGFDISFERIARLLDEEPETDKLRADMAGEQQPSPEGSL